MRKNYFKMLILGVFVLMFCTACNGNVTRSIRHDGFAVSNKIKCEMFFHEGASSYNMIKFFTGSHIIDQNGKIYEVSLSQTYQNGQNCKDSGKNIIVKSIMDNNIVRGADNGYYYLNGSGQTSPYTKISESDNNYAVYNKTGAVSADNSPKVNVLNHRISSLRSFLEPAFFNSFIFSYFVNHIEYFGQYLVFYLAYIEK